MATTSRRDLLIAGLGSTALLACSHGAASAKAKREGEGEGEDEDVTPAEDLMREHGVLRRILIVFEEGVRRLEANEPVPADALASAAHIVRTFVEDYHEKLEENHLFPRFEAAKQLVELVAVLRVQHQAGRALTDKILAGATAAGLADATTRTAVIGSIRAFGHMYAAHAAREDTVLFSALPKVISRADYKELGERFEDEEHRLFGARGFFGVVDEVAAIEASLGIADLAVFTPRT